MFVVFFLVDPTDRIGLPRFFAFACCGGSHRDTVEVTNP